MQVSELMKLNLQNQCQKVFQTGPIVIMVSTRALQALSLGSIPNGSTIIARNRVRNFHPKSYRQRNCSEIYIFTVSKFLSNYTLG